MQKLYTKTTVSELKFAAMADKDEAAYHQFEEREVEPILPAFLKEEEGISVTTRGNAYHKVMELMEFEEVLGSSLPMEQVLQERLEKFVERKVMSEEYYNALNLQKLVTFLQDPLAKRMWQAQKRGLLYREQPFVLGISAGRLGEEFPAQEKVLIQGIIDAFFVEDGEIVLLDYKTDKVQTPKELWDRYETQLDYYEEALTKLMQMPVKEKILYSFGLGKCVRAAGDAEE